MTIRSLRALTVARAEGTRSERNYGLLGFVLCRFLRQGGQPISANRLPQRRAVNAGIHACRGCGLTYDGDCRGMAIEVQQVLGQHARDLVGLSQRRSDPVRQPDNERGGPAKLFDLGNYRLTVAAGKRGHQDDCAYLLPGSVEQWEELAYDWCERYPQRRALGARTRQQAQAQGT